MRGKEKGPMEYAERGNPPAIEKGRTKICSGQGGGRGQKEGGPEGVIERKATRNDKRLVPTKNINLRQERGHQITQGSQKTAPVVGGGKTGSSGHQGPRGGRARKKKKLNISRIRGELRKAQGSGCAKGGKSERGNS